VARDKDIRAFIAAKGVATSGLGTSAAQINFTSQPSLSNAYNAADVLRQAKGV
jgi:hypothetical protein